MKTKSIIILLILFVGLVAMSFYGEKLREGLTSEGLNGQPGEQNQANATQVNSNPVNNQLSSDSNATKYGSDILQSGTSLYGPNGEICKVLVNQNNKQYLEVRDSITKSPIYYNYDLTSKNNFTGPNGSSAEAYLGNDKQPNISITDGTGNTKVFSMDGIHTNSNNIVSNMNYNPAVDIGFTGSPMGSNNYNSVYSSSLPNGIPASQIVPGTEDLYILKSQVVPPVCPICPATKTHDSKMQEQSNSKCPPCPACARCPEPAFECKKVPNYKSMDNQSLPFPVLNNFTSFGM